MDSMRVLIVDDSLVRRKIVALSPRQAGIYIAKFLKAENGAEALGILQQGKGDLIFCDVNMPVMDGLQFVKQLCRVQNAKGVLEAVIITESSEGHPVQTLSAGARSYIRKPFTPDQIKEDVLSMLAGNL